MTSAILFRKLKLYNHPRVLLQLRCCSIPKRSKSTITGSDHTGNSDLTSPSKLSVPPDEPFPSPYKHHDKSTPARSPSKLTTWILQSPARKAAFLRLGDLLGFGSPKQVAVRRAKIIYEQCSEIASGPEAEFWYDRLSLPPTFQSWFTITNLHVWMAIVRLRALPSTHGKAFVQALIDHFFFDVEDRLRAVLGKNAPERLVTRQMKIFREQWNGLNISCDIAFLTGDKEMASTMWRNLLGARGAKGIRYSDPLTSPAENQNNAKTSIDDPSTGGVVDFEGPSIDKYLLYPQLMLLLTSYVRREIARLETVSDETILGGEGRGLREAFREEELEELNPDEDGGRVKARLDEAFRFESVKAAGEDIGVKLE